MSDRFLHKSNRCLCSTSILANFLNYFYELAHRKQQGVKRVPIEIKSHHWQSLLDRLLKHDEAISKGSLKLYQKKGKWYALVSLSEEVPETNSANRIGVDRGQNQLATAVPKQGFGLLFSGKEVMFVWSNTSV